METTKTNELSVLVDGNQLESKTALMLKEKFMPFFEKAIEWKEKAQALVVTDINQTDEMKQAREARLALKDIRVEADKLRKELKEDSLRYGKAVQSVYNMIEGVITPIEEHLLQQEKFVEIEEARIKAELADQRHKELEPYSEFVPLGIDFGNMVEEDYQKFLNGVKLQQKDKEEKEAKELAERLAREKKEQEEREAQAKENERLRKEKEEREAEEKAKKEVREKRNLELRPYIIFIRDYNAMLELPEEEYQLAFSEMKKGAEDHWEYERQQQIKKAQEDQEREEALRKEKEKADRLAKELADKKAKEEKETAERLAKEEEELSKGDTAKMADVIVTLNTLKTKYEFKSKKFQKKYKDMGILIDKVIEHIHK